MMRFDNHNAVASGTSVARLGNDFWPVLRRGMTGGQRAASLARRCRLK
jgi:hypothetical protein